MSFGFDDFGRIYFTLRCGLLIQTYSKGLIQVGFFPAHTRVILELIMNSKNRMITKTNFHL